MLRPRIIPCLLVRNKGLVKTVRFSAGKYVGDPINAVRIFNEKEADELIMLDIDATATAAEPDYRMIGNLAAECRMPLCYGGGVRTVEHARTVVSLGVEKVAIGAAAMENPQLISMIAEEIGSQSVVVVLDVKERFGGNYEVMVRNGRVGTSRSPGECAGMFERLGAGEILVSSIDNDGAMCGYDLTLAKTVREAISVPMTVLGGAGSLGDIAALIRTFGIVGAAAGSLFVFKGVYRAVLINYPSFGEREELARARYPT